jgi:hypothetical protein
LRAAISVARLSNHEGLADLLERELADAHAAVRLERDEPEGRKPAESLPHGCAADAELLGEVLLAQHTPGRDLTRDDRLLERQRDVVRLRPVHQPSSMSLS